MDASRFDALARQLAAPHTRRGALKALLGAALAGGWHAAFAAPLSCPPGQIPCSGGCANILNDPRNCGHCGFSCPTGAACINASCCLPAGTGCGGPGECCNGGDCVGSVCCGGLGTSCSVSTDCCTGHCAAGGRCGCPDGQVYCAGSCCPTAACCNGTCCPGGQTCDALGRCGPCSRDEELCESTSGFTCCPTAAGPCCRGECCTRDLFYCTEFGCGNCFTDTQCQAQTPGATCVQGRCKLPCTSNSCPNGCCDPDGNCLSSGDTTCGTGGAACQNCAANNQICQSGTCVFPGCTGIRGTPTATHPCCAGLTAGISSCDSGGNYCLVPQCVTPGPGSPTCGSACDCFAGYPESNACTDCVGGQCVPGGGNCQNPPKTCSTP